MRPGAVRNLGAQRSKPLNDDDFLRAHWISYFKYSRDKGKAYARFLLDEHFTPRHVHELIERDVSLESIEEQQSEDDADVADDLDGLVFTVGEGSGSRSKLAVEEVGDYVVSLGESAGHWFNSFYPRLAIGMSEAERSALDRLNRIGMGYFRPLVMVILRSVGDESGRLLAFAEIERFIFIAFRMGTSKSNYRSSEFYRLAWALSRKQTTLKEIRERLNTRLAYLFDKEEGTLRIDEFYSILVKKFDDGTGYYGWSGLRYLLYEYEQKLFDESRQRKVEWDDLLKSSSDRISIEHIYPQTPTEGWGSDFKVISEENRKLCGGALGNLLLLSMSINASLQNDEFVDKKQPRYDAQGRKIRNGYSDGSHSEIEVAANPAWGPKEIRARSLALLRFMEERWRFRLSESDRVKLLFLPPDPIADHKSP